MITSPDIRLRFGPSPTGFLHIGGVRTALFSYLYARQQGGKFILRVEDTDQARKVDGSVGQIIESLQWLGLTPDEGVTSEGKETGELGPYTQSERLGIYQDYADQLLKAGKAYYSYISPEDFNRLRDESIAAKKPFVYRQEMEPPRPDDADKVDYPVRLKVEPGQLTWHDEVYGSFDVSQDTLDDFVLIKADGFPTYNFANVIDDHLMEISHVVRGPEFLPSTPKFILVYNYFGWQPPKFVHAPVILGPDGKKKLSKRDGDVDVLEFRDKGYLPDVIINFLAQLGWNDGTTKDIFTRDELIQAFSLERIQKSPAKFDIERLNWMNGEYIRNVISQEEYIERAKAALQGSDYDISGGDSYIDAVLLLDRERVKLFSEVPGMVRFFFVAPDINAEFVSLLTKKAGPEKTAQWLGLVEDALTEPVSSESGIEQALRGVAERSSLHVGDLFYTIRVAITGRTAAPGLFETIHLLGLEESKKRLAAARSAIA